MVCRLCGRGKARSFRVEAFEYGECPDCGYVGLVRRFFPSRAEEAARYRLHRNDPVEPGYRAYLGEFVDEALAPFLEPGASILDYGSGPVPALSLLLGERGFRALPYDPFFATGAAWRGRSWDAIALHEVAEHLRAPGRSLAYLAARLASGGILAVRTRFAPAREDEFAVWWYRRDLTHLGFWRASSFEFLAERLGLDLLAATEPDIAVLRRSPAAP
jgi:hypothetical protein